jgi:hypothetical protein
VSAKTWRGRPRAGEEADLPVAIYFAMGEPATRLLEELEAWLGAHNAAIMAVLCLVVGAKLIGDGVSGLS